MLKMLICYKTPDAVDAAIQAFTEFHDRDLTENELEILSRFRGEYLTLEVNLETGETRVRT